jgi:hypothetical protein
MRSVTVLLPFCVFFVIYGRYFVILASFPGVFGHLWVAESAFGKTNLQLVGLIEDKNIGAKRPPSLCPIFSRYTGVKVSAKIALLYGIRRTKPSAPPIRPFIYIGFCQMTNVDGYF